MPAPRLQPHAPVLVYSTAPSREVADRLARAMVEQRLAACVNLFDGMRSVYRWQDALAETAETAMLIKTTGRKTALLQQFIEAEHPYDTPCFLVIDIAEGMPAFLQWMDAETR